MNNLIILSLCVVVISANVLRICDGDISCSCCDQWGNVYTPDRDSGCDSYFHKFGGVLQRISCPGGLKFDVNTCVCNWANQVACPACEGDGSGESI